MFFLLTYIIYFFYQKTLKNLLTTKIYNYIIRNIKDLYIKGEPNGRF